MSTMWGTELGDNTRFWRRGLEERIESSWDTVGGGDMLLGVRSRVVRAVVFDFNKPHDDIVHPEKWRYFSFGRRWRAKKSEMSTVE